MPVGYAGSDDVSTGFMFCTCDCYDFERRGPFDDMSPQDFERRLPRLDTIGIASADDDDALEWLLDNHAIVVSPAAGFVTLGAKRTDIEMLDSQKLFWRVTKTGRIYMVTKTIKPRKTKDDVVTYHLVKMSPDSPEQTAWCCKHIMFAAKGVLGGELVFDEDTDTSLNAYVGLK